MKKIFAILLCAGLILSLAACSGSSGQGSSGSTGVLPVEPIPEPAEQPGEASDAASSETISAGSSEPASEAPGVEPAEGKTLVVYYSATNNTEAIAGYIAGATGADLFELVPVDPYSSDDLNWTNRNSRVSKEHDDESLRVVELENAVPDHWEDYDTVFIGYPIWWGIAAWPVNGFISANDFTGKTVIPFCTSSTSGIGQSGELLRDAAGTGNWLEGRRFPSRESEETVKEWVASLER